MKAWLACCLFVLTLCSPALAGDTVLVFAGAGMRKPLDAIAARFEAQSGIRVVHDYEGSGRLASKILAGQKPDVFIPGAKKWAALLKEKGYVTRWFGLARHIPVILTPAGNTKVNSLADFAKPGVRLVLGDGKACAIGRVGARVLKNAGLDESSLNVAARGVSVKQLVRWVEFGNADATIAWRADGFGNDKVRIVTIPEEINDSDIIPACAMASASHPDAAARYLDYLAAHSGPAFSKAGFLLPE